MKAIKVKRLNYYPPTKTSGVIDKILVALLIALIIIFIYWR